MNEKQKIELNYLTSRSLLIFDFIFNKTKNDPILLELRDVITNAHAEENLKGIRMLARDMNSWAKGLPKKDIEELEVQLLNKFEEDLSGDKTMNKTIRKVLTYRKIKTSEEYRVVHEYLQDLSEKDEYYKNQGELELILRNASNKEIDWYREDC